jgi:alpha-glucosidase
MHPPSPCGLRRARRVGRAPVTWWAALVCGLALSALDVGSQTPRQAPIPRVTPPPESFFQLVNEQDREVARKFYAKYIDVRGMPVVAAAVVDDAALQRTYTIVTSMLAGRPDIIQALVKTRMYLIIIGKDQLYTDMPEYRNSPNPAYQNERVRGTGGRPTSFGEENLLTLPIDRYDDESIGVHEFCHTVDGALRSIDSTWTNRRNAAHQNARDKGLYQWAYAQSNAGEYWGEICQTYFDTQRVNNWNHNFVGTREQLKEYDPIGYELARTAFNLTPENDWRYAPMRVVPNVTPPPAKFGIDPWYTKFTWAREFTVVGRGATDESLLRANDVIRKMFAYRHDILKALIADGVKLVVLGRGERISDLPEYTRLADKRPVDAIARVLDYSPAMKLLVVGEENVLGDPGDPRVGDNRVIRVFARALYDVTGHRAIDPNAGKGSPQQYELRVQRLDLRFDQKLEELYAAALKAGKWRGTSAMNDRAEYWVRGVLAYFDAAGQHQAPLDTSHPIATREALQVYDPGLFSSVEETMAYKGKTDWRLSSRQPAQAAR